MPSPRWASYNGAEPGDPRAERPESSAENTRVRGVVIRTQFQRHTPAGQCANLRISIRAVTTGRRVAISPPELRGQVSIASDEREDRFEGRDCTVAYAPDGLPLETDFVVRVATRSVEGQPTEVELEPGTHVRIVLSSSRDVLPTVTIGERNATEREVSFLSRFLMMYRERHVPLMPDGQREVGVGERVALSARLEVPFVTSAAYPVVVIEGVGMVRRLLRVHEQNGYEISITGRSPTISRANESARQTVTAQRELRLLHPRRLDANEAAAFDRIEWNVQGEHGEGNVRFRYEWRRVQTYTAEFSPWFARPAVSAETASADAGASAPSDPR
jgi:hypothetical protein